jgi:hypothetical protein
LPPPHRRAEARRRAGASSSERVPSPLPAASSLARCSHCLVFKDPPVCGLAGPAPRLTTVSLRFSLTRCRGFL